MNTTPYDAFEVLKRALSSATIHNVRLVDVQRAPDGFELLVVEHAGVTREVAGGRPWSDSHSGADVGRHGYLIPATGPAKSERPAGSCHFRAYVDPSLRRLPELDTGNRPRHEGGCSPALIGWRCDSRPDGFLAPGGLIPGANGRFVPDETVEVTVRVPPEFVRECRRVQMTPEGVLQGFIADLAGIQNFVACPRADHLGSNGSDERDFAEAWLQRAYGFNSIDLDEADFLAEQDLEKQAQRDNFADLLDDFEAYGGRAEDLMGAVEDLVKKQSSTDDDGSAK